MLLATIETIGRDFKVLGMVCGSATKSEHAWQSIVSEVKNLLGQDDKEMNLLRKQALQNMEREALELGADAVIGVKYDSHLLPNQSFEVLVYGTAIRFS